MSPTARALAAGACILGAVLAGGAAPLAHPDGPLPGFTGGFGEADCGSCHVAPDTAPPAGTVRLEGVPEAYREGASYPLTVRIARPGLRRGGFQLSARIPRSGSAAGALVTESDAAAVDRAGSPPVLYARQTLAGSRTEADTLEWRVVWRAPEDASDTVVFNLAVNLADDDGTEWGDVVETVEVRSAPR